MAFLSTTAVSAINRLGAARGRLRMDGLPFADTVGNIQNGILWNPLVITNAGGLATYRADVYTGRRPGPLPQLLDPR